MRSINRKFLTVLICVLFLIPTLSHATLDTGNVSRLGTDGFFGIKTNTKYDMTFRNASLREVLQFLSWVADVNIIIPEGIEGLVNVSFQEIMVTDAMNAVIRANALEFTLEGGVVRIGKEDQFKESGEDLKTETFRLRYAPAIDMLPKVKALLSGRGSSVADARTNSLVIRELISNIDNIRRFIADVDVKDAQVLIESKILEATRQFSRSLGIQWGANRGAAGSSWRFGGVQAVGQADSGSNLNQNFSPTAPTSGLLIGSLFKGTSLDVQILAAEQRGDAYVISDPSIVTSNGESANIRSGTTLLVQGSGTVNIGTSSGSNTSTGTSGLEEIETGVELTVTPQITVDDFVKLKIKTMTSTPDFTRAIQGIPVIVDNTATTTVLVKDGETTVIGGLSRFSDTLSEDRVPGLYKIPLLGKLFKSKDRKRENTELMVFIRPTIIRVEGLAPAQVRIHELEERQQAMFLKPMLDPKKEKEKKMKEAEVRQNRKGNKYLR